MVSGLKESSFLLNNQQKTNIFFYLTDNDFHMHCQKVPKSEFQSQFAMSKIILIFPVFHFIEKYQFRRRFFAIDSF